MNCDRFRTSTRNAMVGLAVVMATSAPAAPAAAHEFWLEPARFQASAGETIQVAAFVGTGFRGEARPYAVRRTVRFAARGADPDDMRRTSVNGSLVFGKCVARDARGALVGYQSNFVPIELGPAEFDRYLALEGLDEVLATRTRLGTLAGAGRERYARCPKTWLAGADAHRVTHPLGLALELVPLAEPGAPGPLRVRVLFEGRPIPGVLVRAWRQPLRDGWIPEDAAARDSVGPVAEARADSDGIATLAISGAGEWMLSAVHMEPCPDPRIADWQSLWASLTFVRGAEL